MLATQVSEQHLVIVNDTRIQDGKQQQWPLPVMADRIAAEVATRHIDTVCRSSSQLSNVSSAQA